MNRTKKRVHQKIEIAFNFLKKIPLKHFGLQFYMRNPLKIKNLNRLQFYKRNPFKIFGLKFYMKNPFKIYSTRLQLNNGNPFKKFSENKFTLKSDLKNTPYDRQVGDHF